VRLEDAISELEGSKGHVRFSTLLGMCNYFFGRPRNVGSHHIFKTPWIGDPRINLQENKGDAKPYQVRQLLAAVERYERLSKGTDDDG
jgi:hypothetical protein